MRIKNPECWEEYCNIIQEQKNKHFIEEAPQISKLQQKQQNTTITQRLVENLYVDNVLMLDNSTHSLQTYHTCKKIFANMSMNLRHFITNDEICNKSIGEKDKLPQHQPKS
ncbi:hypothetical protein OSTOST_02412 [Ostertagia ostertagi]